MTHPSDQKTRLPEVVARWGLVTLDVPPLQKPSSLGELFQEAGELAERLDRLRSRRADRGRTPLPSSVQAATAPSPRLTAEQMRELCLAISSLHGQLPDQARWKTSGAETSLAEHKSRAFFRTKSLENLEGRLVAALVERMDLAKRILGAASEVATRPRSIALSNPPTAADDATRSPEAIPRVAPIDPRVAPIDAPLVSTSDEATLLDFPPPARAR